MRLQGEDARSGWGRDVVGCCVAASGCRGDGDGAQPAGEETAATCCCAGMGSRLPAEATLLELRGLDIGMWLWVGLWLGFV